MSNDEAGPTTGGYPNLQIPSGAPPSTMPNRSLLSATQVLQLRSADSCLLTDANISAKQRRNARKRMAVPDWEDVVGLIDDTLTSSGKKGLVLGRAGIYGERDGSTKTPYFLPWKEVETYGSQSFSEGWLSSRCRIGRAVFSIPDEGRHDFCLLLNRLWDDATTQATPQGTVREAVLGVGMRPATTGVEFAEGIDLFARYLGQVYTVADITKEQESGARESAYVPAEERIVAIVMMQAGVGFVVGESGLYYNQEWFGSGEHMPEWCDEHEGLHPWSDIRDSALETSTRWFQVAGEQTQSECTYLAIGSYRYFINGGPSERDLCLLLRFASDYAPQ